MDRSYLFEELAFKGRESGAEIAMALLARPDAAHLPEGLAGTLGIDLAQHQLTIALNNTGEQWRISTNLTPRVEGLRNELSLAQSLLKPVRLLGLDIKVISQPSYSREIVPHIGQDGAGLATVLSWLQGERYETFDEIQSCLRDFVPEIDRIRFRRAPIFITDSHDVPVALDEGGKTIFASRSSRREEIGNEILIDFRHARGVPAKHVSEGTLLLLGLLTVVLAEDVSVLLLDDIDRALHPKAQQQLIAYLRRLTQRSVQVIGTTHSPYLVLHLEYEEVRAMTMSDAGGALIGKLTEHPEYPRWHEHMSTSEFWTVFGEEWLAKARAHG